MIYRGRKFAGIAVATATVLVLSGCPGSSDDSSVSLSPPQAGNNITNNPPDISGTPTAEIKIGDAYSFTPVASDSDGDDLIFSIENMPGWSTFDSSTGTLSGTPSMGDEGTYDDISITVSDGSTNSSLPIFTVSVTQNGSGSITLSWTPPTTNTDGSPLTDIAAYKFYYGVSEGNYPNQIRVDSPGITSYMIESLTPNTYFFVSTVINTSGIESRLSNVASMTVTAN